MQGELKVRELERFKACYCGLCHCLGSNYGIASRFTLSYELVFLSMLLWEPDEAPQIRRGRCIASPFRKKCYCARNKALDISAGYNVILAWWRIQDAIADEAFFRKIPYRIASLALHKAYRRALNEYPLFNSIVSDEIKSLAAYEAHEEQSLDGAADKFSRILKAAAPELMAEQKRRPLTELLYHLGRWIYIVDAYDDYKDDALAGRYNPVTARYPPDSGSLPDDSVGRLKTTLAHSNNLVCSAFELLPENTWSEIVRNMIYLGMPDVCSRVLAGNWPPARRNGKNTRNGNDI